MCGTWNRCGQPIRFLKRRGAAGAAELEAAIKAGQVELTGLYLNLLSGLCRPEGEDIGKPVETDTDSQGSDDYLLNYFRGISAVDDDVGRLLTELDSSGMASNTVVVFVGDNGYFLGEHGLGDKRSAYDESMRIPMLLRYPPLVKPGTLMDEMVLNIDLAPTFLQLAGVPVPSAMQGLSWVPLLRGEKPAWRQAFLYEYFFEPGLPATPGMLAVRTPFSKLIVYPGHDDWTELFDLNADPCEKQNLTKDPSRRSMLTELQTELTRQKQKFGDPFAVRPAQSK